MCVPVSPTLPPMPRRRRPGHADKESIAAPAIVTTRARGLAALAGLAAATLVPSGTGLALDLPQAGGDPSAAAPQAPSPVAPGGTAPSPAAAATAPAPGSVDAGIRLRLGARGDLVRELQRELRRRGAALRADGVYGRSTVRAVRWIQARQHLRRTGVADATLLSRIGIQTLTVAGTPASAALPPWVRMQVWPATGQLSSPFGPRWGRMHEGMDIADRPGTPIVAALPGTVSFAGWYGGYGNLVRIDHGNGLETRYGHMRAILVAVGQPVAAGQQIGEMGTTGSSTGTHLHFEVRLGGTPYNPLPTLPPRG